MPGPQVFPLRWESTGDQWWYASPIDWAAANGHYDVVRELLHLDPNLIMKLTSLRRLRRLETLWEDEDDDDHSKFQGAAAVCRAHIAKNLLTESENKKGKSLIGAGYGGWLLYTAAAAGDTGFMWELLEREPLLVFGEGEYGVSDILYAAARSKNSEVFRWLLNLSLKVAGEGIQQQQQQQQQQREVVVVVGEDINNGSRSSVFRWEMMNRAAHAAARGGNREMMREIIVLAEEECRSSRSSSSSDGKQHVLLAFRDAQGSTLLHSASARGQIEVVNDLVSSYGSIIVTSTDNHGNRALSVAAYRGHLAVVEALISHSELYHHQNNYGDTFLHMAVAGFTSPGFRRLDHQMNLMKHLITNVVNIGHLINLRNNEGRTALHCALALNNNIPCEVLHLLMSVPYINLNIRDHEGMTPLDLLQLLLKKKKKKKKPSEILMIKRSLMISNNNNNNYNSQEEEEEDYFMTRTRHLRSQSQSLLLLQHHQTHDDDVAAGAGNNNSSEILVMNSIRSPGASFRISDADILFYASPSSQPPLISRVSNNSSPRRSFVNPKSSSLNYNNNNNNTATRLMILLRWPKKKNIKDLSYHNDDDDYSSILSSPPKLESSPTPLRHRFAKHSSSLPNNKRVG